MMSFLFFILALIPIAFGASPALEQTVDQVVSVFENDSTTIQYSYIEALDDGRGFTAGKAGFTTATGDLLDVVLEYENLVGKSSFHDLLPLLKLRASSADADISGLEKLSQLWPTACSDPNFISAQDKIVEDLYKIPAHDHQKKLGFSSNLSYLVFYDTIIQHGDGDDPDSFSGVLQKMSTRSKDEKKFLLEFLSARRKVLMNSSDSETRNEWRESVGRVNVLVKLVKNENWTLATPFSINPWGTLHEISLRQKKHQLK